MKSDAVLMAEQSVIGGLMIDASEWPKIKKIVSSGDFSSQQIRDIFKAIAEKLDSGQPADEILLSGNKNINPAYIVELAKKTSSAANIVPYAREVRKHADKRKFLADTEKSISSVKNGISTPAEAANDLFIANQPKSNESPLKALKSLSAVTRIADMEKNLSKDFFIFDELALDGQVSLFYAKPNTGKTLFFLRFLTDAIEEGRIKGNDIFYINADDHYKGFLTKVKIAKKHGFEMISPQESGVPPKKIIQILDDLSRTDDAKGKIIILDTLKKFVDMMSKKAQSGLNQILRKLIAKNASVIIAGHANKYPDAEGNLIYEGTSDVMNDIDCAYSINRVSDSNGVFVVRFQCEKSRGSNIQSISYEYQKNERMGYYDILASITKLDQQNNRKIDEQIATELLREKYESEILFLTQLLKNGNMIQSEILKEFDNKEAHTITAKFSRRSLQAALKKLDGIDWESKRGDKNTRIYTLKINDISSYSKAKNGG